VEMLCEVIISKLLTEEALKMIAKHPHVFTTGISTVRNINAFRTEVLRYLGI
jgi:hypothetical protein